MTAANKPLIPYGWLRALVYILLSLLFSLGVMLLSGVTFFSVDAGKTVIQEAEQSLLPFLSAYTMLGLVFIGVAFFMTTLVDKQSLRSVGFQWKGFQQQAAAGFFLAVLLLSLGSILLVMMQYLFFTGVAFNKNNLLYSTLLFIIVAFTEEIAFRGYILRNLMESMGKWTALTISSVIFALVHFTNPGGDNWLPMINIFIAGFLLGINYIYTRNLWFAIFLHFSWNFFQGPVLGYEVSGLSSPGLLQQTLKGPVLYTGGDFGFEGSLICLLLNLVACIGLWRYYRSRNNQPVIST